MRKRRPFGPVGFDDDFFQEFDRIEEMMREMLESHFERGFEDLGGFKPKVYGFTLEFSPEGKAKLTQFGNQQPGGRMEQKQKERDFFVDVINTPDNITVIAELPGVDEKHLALKAFPKQLSIRVSDPNRLLAKTIVLPAEILADSFKHSIKNGILEVVLKKKSEEK